MSFSSDIADFKRKTLNAATKVYRGSSLEILSAIIKRTPVDTGRLRGNWQTDVNVSPIGTVETDARRALTLASKKASSLELNDTILMMNNLPYAAVIENGSSKQAPAGMLRVTILEWQRAVSQKARAVK